MCARRSTSRDTSTSTRAGGCRSIGSCGGRMASHRSTTRSGISSAASGAAWSCSAKVARGSGEDRVFDALRPYWYPVALSSEVAEKPVAATLLGERVVVYRTGSQVHALKDLCIHRGTPLSLGWIDGDTLVCAYHGWGYAVGGTCVRIPSLPPGRGIPPKAKVHAYEAAEKYGLVWVALETPREPIPEWADNEDARFRTIWTQYRWKANAARAIENVMDFAHFPWVHPGVLGDRSKPMYPEIKVQTDGNLIRYVV